MNQEPMQSGFGLIYSSAVPRRALITWRSSYVLGVILCLFYVTMMYYTPVAVMPLAGADDGHYIQQGIELARGHWLGGYDHMTLIKGPGLPIFLALSKVSGLPYSISLALIEAGSFFLLSFVVGRLISRPALALLMLGVLLTFPWTWSGANVRVLRDAFYTSLIFVFLSLSFLTIWNQSQRNRYYALAAGLVLGVVSITREENPWLWPALAALALTLFLVERRRGRGLAAVFMIIAWAAVGLVAVRGTILTINYAKYKTFDVSDFHEKNFLNALGALYSVESGQRVPYFAASREARLAIYDHSPTFARLRPFLDDDQAPLSGWQTPGCQAYGGKACGDYMAGWFMWAFRDAVFLAGGYANAKTAAEFYRRISEEIERACKDKELTCRYHPIAEIPPLVWQNFVLLFGSVIKTVKLVTLSTPVSDQERGSHGPPDMLRSSMTFLNLSFIARQEEIEPYEAIVSGSNPPPMVVFTRSVQLKIRHLYNAIWPTLCVIAILGILYSTYLRLTTTGIDRFLIMTWTLLILVAARVGLLSIIDATVHQAVLAEYAFPAAYCLAAAVVMGLYSAAQDVKISLRRRR